MQPPDPVPGLYLLPLDDSFFPPKRIALPPGTRVRIGRQLNQKSAPGAGNGVFESRVLSRQHAEAWVEGGRILIRDVKSSNGTFVNGERLSLEGAESDAFELRSDDILEFGIDIVGEHGEVVHRKVAARVTCAFTPADAARAVRAETRVYPPPSASSPNAPNAPPPVPPLPPNISGSSINNNYNNNNGYDYTSPSGGAGSGGDNPAAQQRRPQYAAGLAGMGGMGSERIRPKSMDLDSVLARIRDGGAGVGGGPQQLASNPPLRLPVLGLGMGMGSPVPPVTAVQAGGKDGDGDEDDASGSANGGSANGSADGTSGKEREEEDAALAALRAELASTQSALAEAVRKAEALVPNLGFLSSLPFEAAKERGDVESESTTTTSDTDSDADARPPQNDAAPAPSPSAAVPVEPTPDDAAPSPSPLHSNALSLRASLTALRAEAFALQRAKTRRPRAGTVTVGSYASATVKGHGAGVGTVKVIGKRRARRVGVLEALDIEIDEGEEEEEGEGEGEGGEEDWVDDVDFRAEVADIGPPSPASSPRATTFRFGGEGGGGGARLRGVFDEDGDVEPEEGLLSAAVHEEGRESGDGREGEGWGGGERGEEEEEEGEAHLAALSAQLDALAVQLGTLHGRLGALQEAAYVSSAPDYARPESVGSAELGGTFVEGGTTNDADSEGEGAGGEGRLAGLEGRVRALEGAVTNASASAEGSPTPLSTAADAPSSSPTTPASTSGDAHEDAAAIQAALATGLAALKAEWAAFRAEVASYTPMPVPAFARGVDLGTGAHDLGVGAYDPYAPPSATMASYGPTTTLRRRKVHDPTADLEDSEEPDSGSGSGLSSDGEADDGHRREGLRAPYHVRRGMVDGDDDEGRVPGRWGLLTPEGSVRGDGVGNGNGNVTSSVSVATPTAKSSFWDATENGAGIKINGTSLHAAGAPSTESRGVAHTRTESTPHTEKEGVRVQTDAEQTLLLAGAVGAGIVIVAAAWWGA